MRNCKHLSDFIQSLIVFPGDLMDILALLNSGINFILYCSMSQQFRNTFQVLFRPKFLDRWKPKTNANLNKDTVPVNPNDTNV